MPGKGDKFEWNKRRQSKHEMRSAADGHNRGKNRFWSK